MMSTITATMATARNTFFNIFITRGLIQRFLGGPLATRSAALTTLSPRLTAGAGGEMSPLAWLAFCLARPLRLPVQA